MRHFKQTVVNPQSPIVKLARDEVSQSETSSGPLAAEITSGGDGRKRTGG